MSRAELATALAVTEERIELWEGTGRLPSLDSRRLEWAMACEQRERELAAAGHPSCPVADDIVESSKAEGFEKQMQLAREHSTDCDHCQARIAYIRTLPPLPDFPLPGWMGAVHRLAVWTGTLPAFLRPAVWGAVGFGAMTLFKAVLMTAIAPRTMGLKAWGMALAAVGLGAYMGAVGGLAWSAIKPIALKLGRPGDFLAAAVAVNACLLSVLLPIRLFKMDDVPHTGVFVVTLLAMGTVVGLFLGRSTLRLTPEPKT